MFAQKTNQPSAKVVEGNLIISLPGAKNPIVWRMALGEAKSAALEVREQNNEFTLVLKSPKGDVTEIAPFEKKDDATQALMAVSKAMQESHGQIHSYTPAATTAVPRAVDSGMGWKWLIPLGLILLAIFLYTRAASVVPVDYTATSAGAGAPAAGNSETGVPLSADSFLSGM